MKSINNDTDKIEEVIGQPDINTENEVDLDGKKRS